jgi:UDP-N-acetylmuramyl pentapeptide phosphotransferase/UDP-N-acetylglucosamine-1-phosphate transferase
MTAAGRLGEERGPAPLRRILATATIAALATQFGVRLLCRLSEGRPRWHRQNFRDRPVSLAGGPALVAGLALSGAAAGDGPLVLLAVGAGAAGLLDDLFGQTHARGLRGHARALRSGVVTTGMAKLVALLGLGVALAPAQDSARRRVLAGATIAGAANLVNLLDLRPGRALKVIGAVAILLTGGPACGVAAAGVLGAAVASAPTDLAELTMIGDCGANAAGAVLGWLAVRRLPPPGRGVVLGLIVAATLASERVSFTAVIDRHSALRRLDRLGRAA